MKLSFDFEPLFYVLDKLTCRVMAVRIQDRYEMRGMFFRYDASEVEWEAWPACVGNQEVSFHPSTYEVTKNQKDAIQWAVDHAELPNAHGIFREWADYTPSH